MNKTSDKNGKSLPVISLWNRALTANSEWIDKVRLLQLSYDTVYLYQLKVNLLIFIEG